MVSRIPVYAASRHHVFVATVLIVDDHPSFRATARAILEADGFEVVGEAQDGTSGVEAVHCLSPVVVLLDVQLPDMDGFAVVTTLGQTAICRRSSSRRAATRPTSAGSSTCGARGFVPKAELSGAALHAVLR